MVKKKFIHFLIVLLISLAFLLKSQAIYAAIPAPGGGYWYRGNTHTHGQFSDSNNNDDTALIAGWYRTADYDFLLISEHNDHLAAKQIFCRDQATTSTFLMMCGLELSYSRHTTAFGINQYIKNESSLQDAVTKTLNAGGVPFVNHPQDPVVSVNAFLGTSGLNHFEVVNGGRLGDTPASETLWDGILSAANGRKAYGVAADDNHYTQSDVGHGWIMVRAPALTKADILENVRNGNFYATTGIILNDYQVNKTAKTITVDSQNGNTITFIGNNGNALKTVQNRLATYQVVGNEKYIRAKITNTAGKMAWTQPVFASDFNGGPTPAPTPSPNPYDLNGDGKAGVGELLILLQNWGSTSLAAGDFNNSGKIDVGDLILLLRNWG